MKTERRWRVLVVDDAQVVLDLAKRHLQILAGDVFVAKSAEAGLALALAETPDIIFLDQNMPGMQGTDLCRLLKQTPLTANIPVVFVTARGEDGSLRDFVRAGAARVITKPFDRHDLVSACRDLVAAAGGRP